MRINRYVTHAVVLLMAVVLSSYSVASYLRPTGPISARAANADSTGGAVGDVSLGRYTTIIKPVSIPTAALPDRSPIAYTVTEGDTLASIAAALKIPMREITWSNPGLKLPLAAGTVLHLPPVPGFVVVVRSGDTLRGIASAYGIDPGVIVDFNRIRTLPPAGSVLIVPVDPSVGPNLPNGKLADPQKPGAFICPIPGAKIIQKFGPTSFALEPPYDGYAHFHTGVDIIAGYGTPILAAAGGTVTGVGYLGDYGFRVEVTDSYGFVEVYAHMETGTVMLGQQVQQGDRVGLVGSTGLSIGSHLHLQLEIGGVPTDPLPLAGCTF
ncbi:MAG TPA: M23 family metallopeptidase [Candidatus Dormibacteraeota bacterium]|nr:M23 family metallopeptidase [Candidatus Dormibacteraeota bacterium]